ncbi:MAG: Hsp70 family protein [Erysipelotrichaceae bacterium]|nr:Hsp70 family protein [Erysipelotrichaceae bacterium]
MATFGIDLGTTYSCIAELDAQGNPQVIHNNTDDSDTLASALYFESLENIIIGDSAKEYVETDGANVVQFIKREIGKEDEFPPRILHGQEFTPVKLSSLILQGIKNMAEEQGKEVTDVIITVPAYFGLKERNLTKTAGEAIGLNVMDLINEPTAAALNYCHRLFQEDMNILVYDLGGGTFDVTLIKMSTKQGDDGQEEAQVEVVVTGGNDRLGGKDWDDALYGYVKNKVVEEIGLTEDDLDADTLQTIRSKVEATKKKLTKAEKAVFKVNVDGQIVKFDVTKQEFEDLTRSLVDQTMSYVEGTLDKAAEKLGAAPQIDKVLLVGGSTYMPMIKNAVEARFPGIVQQEDPDRAVAKGAAIYANMKITEITDPIDPDNKKAPQKSGGTGGNTEVNDKPKTTIVDVSPRSFGPAVNFRNEQGQLEFLIDNLVKEGEKMGQTVEKVYGTSVPNQQIIVLQVYESRSIKDTVVPCFKPNPNYRSQEDELYIPQDTAPEDEVKKLGELQLELSGTDPEGTAIYVEFTVNASGIQIKATLSTDMSRSNIATIVFDGGVKAEDLKKEMASFTVRAE